MTALWKDGGKAFEYAYDGALYRCDVANRKAIEIGKAKGPPGAAKKGGAFKGIGKKDGEAKGVGFVPRGRQALSIRRRSR